MAAPAAQDFARACDGPPTGDLNALWQRALGQLTSNPAYAWVRSLVLVRIEGSTVFLAPLRGQENAARLASGQPQQKKIASVLEPLIGRQVTIAIESAPAQSRPTPPAGNARQSQEADGSRGPSQHNPSGNDRSPARNMNAPHQGDAARGNDPHETAPWHDDDTPTPGSSAPGNAAPGSARGFAGPGSSGPASGAPAGGQRRDRRGDMHKAHQLPLVRQLMEMFNADVVDAHPEAPLIPEPVAPDTTEADAQDTPKFAAPAYDVDVDPDSDKDLDLDEDDQ